MTTRGSAEGASSARQPIKTAVALAVGRPGQPSQVLLVRRPDDDRELPGVWGLPAASCRPGESPEEAALRIGVEKLGCPVRLGRKLASGSQQRSGYILNMALFQAWLEGPGPALPPPPPGPRSTTLYVDWRWDTPSALEESARRGSLCSQLLLQSNLAGA